MAPNFVDSVNSVKKLRGFTILELLVAMTIMALLLVLLLNMVNSATKLWRENENRVDSYREARAALGIMTRDLQSALTGATNANQFVINSPSIFARLPSEAIKDTNFGTIFFHTALPTKAQESTTINGTTVYNKSDVCQVGYFMALGRSSSAANSPINTMNIYRYILSSDATFSNLQAVGSNSPFTNNLAITGDQKVELLARNITAFTAKAYTITNNSLITFSATNTPLPDLIELSITAINQDAGKKLGTNATSSDWTSTNGAIYSNIIAPVQQTFTTRIKLNRTK